MLNEFSYQFSGNAISSVYGENARNTRDEFGLTIPRAVPGEPRGPHPASSASRGLALVGANQLFDNAYKNHTFADNLSYQRGNHSFKVRGPGLVREQARDCPPASPRAASRFAAGGGRTAFQNFLTGNRDGLCGAACTYTEAEREIGSRHPAGSATSSTSQDSWRVRPNVTLDLGVRYALYPGVTDENNVLTNFDPSRYVPANAPRFSPPPARRWSSGTGDFAERHRRGRRELALRRRHLPRPTRTTSSRASASPGTRAGRARPSSAAATGSTTTSRSSASSSRTRSSTRRFTNTVRPERAALEPRRRAPRRPRPRRSRSSPPATPSTRPAPSSGTSACSASSTRAA